MYQNKLDLELTQEMYLNRVQMLVWIVNANKLYLPGVVVPEKHPTH